MEPPLTMLRLAVDPLRTRATSYRNVRGWRDIKPLNCRSSSRMRLSMILRASCLCLRSVPGPFNTCMSALQPKAPFLLIISLFPSLPQNWSERSKERSLHSSALQYHWKKPLNKHWPPACLTPGESSSLPGTQHFSSCFLVQALITNGISYFSFPLSPMHTRNKHLNI